MTKKKFNLPKLESNHQHLRRPIKSRKKLVALGKQPPSPSFQPTRSNRTGSPKAHPTQSNPPTNTTNEENPNNNENPTPDNKLEHLGKRISRRPVRYADGADEKQLEQLGIDKNVARQRTSLDKKKMKTRIKAG
jgi:hypothetical protein